MRPEKILPILLFLPVVFIQLVFIPFISLETVVPDMVLILLIFYTLKFGQLSGLIYGAVFGLLSDLIFGDLIGASMFSKTLTAFIIGYMYSEQKVDYYFRSLFFPMLVFLGALIDSTIFSLITNFEFDSNVMLLLFQQSLLPAVYTAIISSIIPFVYPRSSFRI